MPAIPIKEYNRIHKWTQRNLTKTGKCFYCYKKCKTQWSNIDHKYKQIKSEWQEACAKCHHDFDVLMNGKTGRTKSVNSRPRYIKKHKKQQIGQLVIMLAVLDHMRQRATLKT